MDAVIGTVLLGEGINGSLVSTNEMQLPYIISDAKRGNSLRISPDNWINLGHQGGRCLGNIVYCTEGFSLATWINSLDDVWRAVFTNIDLVGVNTGVQVALHLFSGKVKCKADVYDGISKWSAIGDTLSHSPNQWHHIALTWHTTNGLTVYIDGIMEGNSTTPLVEMLLSSQTSDVLIGPWEMDAYLDEMFLWEYEVNASIIQDLYQRDVGETNNNSMVNIAMYLSMDSITNGITLIGTGITGTLSSTTNALPTLATDSKKGNSLLLATGNWVDRGSHSHTCLGNFNYCPNGFSITMWIKYIGTSWECPFTNTGSFGTWPGILIHIKSRFWEYTLSS